MWTMIFTFFKTKVRPAHLLGGIVVGLIIGLGWYIDHLQNKLEIAQHEKREIVGDLRDCQSANAGNTRTINRLYDANEKLKEAVRVSDKDKVAAVETLRRLRSESQTRLENLLVELNTLRNEDPTCADIQDFDIGVVCPAAVERLRMRAGADSQDRGCRGPGTSICSSP